MAAGFVAWNLLAERPPAWVWVVLPLAGVFLWTLLEYALHSQLFHDPPRPLRCLSESHGSHHEAPDDPNRIVARLSFSFPVALVLFPLLSLVLWSPQWAGLVMVGLIVEYLSYQATRRRLRLVHHGYLPPPLPPR
ncbi:MAG TPA: sterol desaturase family protein [Gemmataceae bacterium]|nr:sterol desaturase family protein [Gemmataceae bacterium]